MSLITRVSTHPGSWMLEPATPTALARIAWHRYYASLFGEKFGAYTLAGCSPTGVPYFSRGGPAMYEVDGGEKVGSEQQLKIKGVSPSLRPERPQSLEARRLLASRLKVKP